MTFIRTVEDFTCGHCGAVVVGNGYTNHCPVCLWSKHVDIAPGDRQSACAGLMKPTFLEQEKGEWVITHTCVVCGHTKRNKLSPADNFETAVQAVHTSEA